MKKIRMARGTRLTFEEGCNKYLEYCRQRNLREGTATAFGEAERQEMLLYRIPVPGDDELLFQHRSKAAEFDAHSSQVKDLDFDNNAVSLSKLLGHSSLEITQNYIHLLVSDIAEQVDEFNVLDKFYGKKRISMIKE